MDGMGWYLGGVRYRAHTVLIMIVKDIWKHLVWQQVNRRCVQSKEVGQTLDKWMELAGNVSIPIITNHEILRYLGNLFPCANRWNAPATNFAMFIFYVCVSVCLCVCWQPTLQITQIRHMHCIYAVCAHFTKTQKDMHTQIDTDTETQIQRQTPLLKVLSCLYFLTDNYKRHGRTLCFTHADKPVQLIW